MTRTADSGPPILVFTDLDGTLLDHQSYDWSPARPALHRLAAIGAQVIPATSKTRAEVLPLMTALGLTGPAIVENGAGVANLPGPAPCIDRIRVVINALPAALRAQFTGFGDGTAADVAALTGLAPDDAARAHAREFSEPGLWSGDDAGLVAFEAALADHGLTLRRGGRFIHVLPGADKAARMAEIRAAYPPCPAIALGDAPNDAEMLAAADIAIIVPNPSGPPPYPPGEAPAHARIAPAPGPTGWNAAMLAALDDLGLSAPAGRIPHG